MPVNVLKREPARTLAHGEPLSPISIDMALDSVGLTITTQPRAGHQSNERASAPHLVAGLGDKGVGDIFVFARKEVRYSLQNSDTACLSLVWIAPLGERTLRSLKSE